MINWLA